MEELLQSLEPEDLVDEIAPAEVFEHIREGEELSELSLEVLDHVLREWTQRYTASEDRETIADLSSLIGLLIQELKLPESSRERFKAWREIAESRRLVLATRDPERIAQLPHVAAILSCLKASHGPIVQGKLIDQAELPIGKSRLSQIIELMVAEGLITARKEGRERLIERTSVAPFTEALRRGSQGSNDRELASAGSIGRDTFKQLLNHKWQKPRPAASH